MLGNRKNIYDTLALVLQNTENSINISNLFYKSETSFRILKRALNVAMDKKLVEKKESKYQRTPKGSEWLSLWNTLQDMLKEEPK